MKDNKKRNNYIPIIVISVVINLTIIAAIIITFIIIKQSKNEPQIPNTSSTHRYSYDNDVLSNIPSAVKPIIYLYPNETTNVSIKLGRPKNISCSYPKYTNGWTVEAQPNGILKYLETDRELYSLYYECSNFVDFKIEKDGFVVKSEDSSNFLEEKLATLGLNERESEEFIVYWLPKLEANEYNYIRFATEEEIGSNMPLDINPNPDTLIRVLMIFKGLDNPIEVEDQQLIAPERKGFVAVEWGGVDLN